MRQVYEAWIDLHAPKNMIDAMGECLVVSKKMKQAFPELQLVKGHYYCLIHGEREHWWLVDPEGDVVDPTAIQFPSKGGKYIQHTGPEPIGKCLNCGDYCYEKDAVSSSVCSKKCDDELLAEYLY